MNVKFPLMNTARLDLVIVFQVCTDLNEHSHTQHMRHARHGRTLDPVSKAHTSRDDLGMGLALKGFWKSLAVGGLYCLAASSLARALP
jgi:hypothetical protein